MLQESNGLKLTEQIDGFLQIVEKEYWEKKLKKEEISLRKGEEEAGQVAFWYEKIRMAIDYREEHLLRITATRRILKRLLVLEGRKKRVAEHLVKELLMGGYIKKSDFCEEGFKKLEKSLDKYILVLNSIQKNLSFADEKRFEARNWFINLASFETEEIFYAHPEKRALINAVFELVSPKIRIIGTNLSLKEKNLKIYLAVFRNLVKADQPIMEGEIFRLYYPDWFENSSNGWIEEIVLNSKDIINNIKKEANDKVLNNIFYALKKQAFFANILYEIALENPAEIKGIVSQEYLLKEFIKTKVEEEYERTHIKLKKRVKRGIIYILITKMLIAILIEAPLEKYLLGSLHYFHLIVNLIFPPIFMAFLALSAKFPGEDNTNGIVDGVKHLVYDGLDIKEIIIEARREASIIEKTLNFVYIVLFLSALAFLIFLLNIFKFTFFNGAIFIIFTATVSFFGALIRQSVRDLTIIKKKEGFRSLIFDTMLLPFVRFGRWLSTNFSKINVFVFVLDIIIEAPFKMMIRLFEAWIDFLKRKREEANQQFE